MKVTLPLRVLLCVRMRNRKLHNIRPSGAFFIGSPPWGVLYDVRVLEVAWLPELHVAVIIICPFSAILLAPLIMVFTYGVFGYVLQVDYHVPIAFLLYFQRSSRFLIPSSNFPVYSTF